MNIILSILEEFQSLILWDLSLFSFEQVKTIKYIYCRNMWDLNRWKVERLSSFDKEYLEFNKFIWNPIRRPSCSIVFSKWLFYSNQGFTLEIRLHLLLLLSCILLVLLSIYLFYLFFLLSLSNPEAPSTATVLLSPLKHSTELRFTSFITSKLIIGSDQSSISGTSSQTDDCVAE